MSIGLVKQVMAAGAAFLFWTSSTFAFDLSGTVFESEGTASGVDPYLLYSVALAESGWAPTRGAKLYGPWPLTIRVNTDSPKFSGGHRFHSLEKAHQFIDSYLTAGGDPKNIDLGLMQVSYRYHKNLIEEHGGIKSMLNLRTNIRAGAQVLRAAIDSSDDPVLSVGRYHTWGDKQAARQYGRWVFEIYERLMILRNEAKKDA